MAIDTRTTLKPKGYRGTPGLARAIDAAKIDKVPTVQPTAHVAATDAERAVVTGRHARHIGAMPVTEHAASATTARQAYGEHLKARRATSAYSIEQRKFLRTAFKELARPKATLEDHTSLRALASELGVLAAFDEILAAHGTRLLPELLDKAHVFAGATALLELASVADAMGERAAFDVHVSEELTVARSWAKNDDDRAEVEVLARQLGLSVVPAVAAPSSTRRRLVQEDLPAVRKSRRMITKSSVQWLAYQNILEMLARGQAGHNQHALSRELAGLHAADLPGSGAGRGAMRVIYEINDDRITIRDIDDYH